MKNEYSLLNSVEFDFSEYTLDEVNELEKKRMFQLFLNSKNRKAILGKKKFTAIAVAIFLAINLAIYNDKVLAAATSIKYSISSWLGFDNMEENYSTEIGRTVEVKNTKLTVNEFFIGNSRIIINLNINMNQNDALENYHNLIPDVYVDGKRTERNSDYVGYRMGQMDENTKESNIILEVDANNLTLNNKAEIRLVFSNLAKECGDNNNAFTYSFIYDSSSYKNASKEIQVNKTIAIGENNLSVDKVIVAPDRVLISGSSKGFSAWFNNKDVNYYYDIVDENNNPVPLKEEIGKGAYFYRVDKNITTLKIIPYTYQKIATNNTAIGSAGKTKYIFEDKIITINLK